jgi:ATP-dependent Lhr-like helicase
MPGRYAWLPALRPGDGGSISEAAEVVARQMLERYGIVARELLDLEAVSLPWGALYDALNLMEMTGEVRRGYFVEGFSGAQFGLPRACDDLKAVQERRTPVGNPFMLLNACDPANLSSITTEARSGGAAYWPRSGQRRGPGPGGEDEEPEAGDGGVPGELDEVRGGRLARLPTNYVVLRDGAPVLALEAAGRRLTPLGSLTGEELEAACGVLRELTEQPWPLRPFRQFRLERWGDRPIRGSEAEGPLRAIGFSVSPKGLEL